MKKISNPCSRCGKERINTRTWKEEVVNLYSGKTTVTYTETVCPDPLCQKIVERELESQRKKKEAFEKSKEDRKLQLQKANKKNPRNSKTSK